MANIELWQSLRSSNMWTEVCAEIDTRIAMELMKLRTCVPDQLKSVQERINMLESFKRFPDEVIDREDTTSPST